MFPILEQILYEKFFSIMTNSLEKTLLWVKILHGEKMFPAKKSTFADCIAF